MKMVLQGKKRRFTGQQPEENSAFRPGDKSVMHRSSAAGFVPSSVCIEFPLFVLLGSRSGDVSSMLLRVRERILP